MTPDILSTISTDVHPGHFRAVAKTTEIKHGGTSSGYESMLRDSEATGSSSGHEDSANESSSETRESKRKGTHLHAFTHLYTFHTQ